MLQLGVGLPISTQEMVVSLTQTQSLGAGDSGIGDTVSFLPKAGDISTYPTALQPNPCMFEKAAATNRSSCWHFVV
jgi:hypothetical protein